MVFTSVRGRCLQISVTHDASVNMQERGVAHSLLGGRSNEETLEL